MNVFRILISGAVAVSLLAGCSGGGGLSGGGSSVPTGPTLSSAVEITASWSGGARGAPTDVKAFTPNSFPGQLCPASSIKLSYGTPNDYYNLVLGNSCTLPVSVAICSFSGTPPGGPGGLNPCATDPLQTNFNTFRFQDLPANSALGSTAITLPTNPSVIIFYCGTKTAFTAPPLSTSVGCLG